ncbi:MAG: hypothetical protein NE334_17085 [Lentisphaeraceae bacterium]|nr:hypothetical protein [Lentisphaeraceae bacterium]
MNISANISAMNTAAFSFATSAHNVANASTPDFKAQEVDQVAGLDGGPKPSIRQSETGTDIMNEVIRQNRLIYDFKANAKVVQTHNDMVGSFIDIIA